MSCYLPLSSDGTGLYSPFVVCGSDNDGTGQYCCNAGDVCLEDYICHFTHPEPTVVSVTGYYIGGCTDQSFSGACSKQCADQVTQDIYYNETTDLWNCCYGDGSLDCGIPSTETFEGPSLSQLEALLSASATSSSYSATSFASISSSSSVLSSAVFTTTTNIVTDVLTLISTSTSCPSNATCASSQGLGRGLEAAIGVLSATCITILAILIFVVHHLRRKRRCSESLTIPVKELPRVATESFLPELGGERQRELDSTARVELNAYKDRGAWT